jgi:hypothetical protein
MFKPSFRCGNYPEKTITLTVSGNPDQILLPKLEPAFHDLGRCGLDAGGLKE